MLLNSWGGEGEGEIEEKVKIKWGGEGEGDIDSLHLLKRR